MKISRRHFLSTAAGAAAGMVLGGCNKNKIEDGAHGGGVAPRILRENTLKFGVFVAEGNDPAAMTGRVIKEIGGMSSLIKEGDLVIVKPNLAADRTPEFAATTNPYVVKKLVELCYKAGARIVKILDRTFNDARQTYRSSGMEKVAEESGADLHYVKDDNVFYELVTAPDGVTLKSRGVYKDIMEADVVINVPILKEHATAGLTIGMKNLMGVIGGDRGDLHRHLHKNLPDLTRIIPVELVVVDAYRILTAHGPGGGNLDDVRMGNTVIACTNVTMADAYAANLFGCKPENIGYLKIAYEQGLGEIYPDKMIVKKFKA